MFIALAVEGATDHAVIENILTGFLDSDEIEINRVQPHIDETTLMQENYGGWYLLLSYLASERFGEDLSVCSYMILQIDTDVSEERHFDVPHVAGGNIRKSIEVLVNDVKSRLISAIEEGEVGLYSKNEGKIIFCINVHSIECWLVQLLKNRKLKEDNLVNCFTKLAKETGISKDFRSYDTISSPLRKKAQIDKLVGLDSSFSIFLKQLEIITLDGQVDANL